MPTPTSRDDFKEYCYRALGKPVLQINVDDDQVEDRIDEALYVFRQYHMDAVTKAYMSHEITASAMVFNSEFSGTFNADEQIIGQTSNVYGRYVSTVNTTAITFFTTATANTGTISSDAYSDTARNTFNDGEVVLGSESGAQGTVKTDGITFGDMDNKWFTVVDSVIGITKVFAPYDSRLTADILFDPQAQFNISLMSSFTAHSTIPYYIGRSYQQLLNDMFRGRPIIRFSRHMNRLYMDVNWYVTFIPGQHIIIEGYRTIDPDGYIKVWTDRWLQRYATSLIKRQWGMNLSKYSGIALPGGVQLDGKSMLAEANQEIATLEEQVRSEFQEPPMFIVG